MFVIPADRLPPGFADRLDQPASDPSTPRPAATIVLIRDADPRFEVLLLRRARSSGFVPGAYVFPGGRVDAQDGDVALIDRLAGQPTGAAGLEPAYLVAALREAFEETGVLLAAPAPDARDLRAWRRRLLAEEADFGEMIAALDVRLGGTGVVYIAHWITPEAEPRRFDTRFFLARVPGEQEVEPDPREMTDALWLTAEEALGRFQAGRLPMVFPTLRTLESLAQFRSAEQALRELRGREVRPILPRLVRTAEGVGILLEGEDA
jgi:8-oxo-dGTP pyrophosphatase MutT (NUDIX family)